MVNVNGGPEGVGADGVVAMVDDVDTMERADDGAALAGMGDTASSVGAEEMAMVETGGLPLSFFGGGDTNGTGAASTAPWVLAASADAGALLSA